MNHNPVVRESTPARLAHEAVHSLSVRQLPRQVPVIELGRVPVQVLSANVVMRSVQAPLQLREVSLRHVGADGATDVLPALVVYGAVGGELDSDGRQTGSTVAPAQFLQEAGGVSLTTETVGKLKNGHSHIPHNSDGV